MGSKKPAAMLLLGILLVAFVMSSSACSGHPGRGLIVSPARLAATVTPGDGLPPIRVVNGGEAPLEVAVYVGRGEHRWDGTPIYLDSPAERAWGAKRIKLDKDALLLGPGEEDAVTAVVGDVTGVEGGFYPVIFFEVKPVGDHPGPMAVSRLAVITLLQLAGSPPPDLAVASVDIQQARPGEPVGFLPLVTNRGKVHGTFSGYIEIAQPDGSTSVRLPVEPVTVLPGCSRQVPLWWHPQKLPVGAYRVSAHLAVGGQPIQADEWAFSVRAPYQLASIRGELVSWQPQRVKAQQAADFSVVVHNSGTEPWQAAGELVILDAAGNPHAAVAVESGEVLPGGSCQMAGLLPPLLPGHYTMRVDLASSGVTVLSAERDLEVLAGDVIASR
ncbi:MAG: hypothetical protein GX341_04650 [Firmicutes bacterium]|nr:hypothetical protein [Bacillota bacterium]